MIAKLESKYFTFHNVSIKTKASEFLIAQNLTFTFHNVSIKTPTWH